MTDPKSSSASSRPGAWEPPSPEDLQAMLPQYEIVTMLGRGGMGAVYKGVQKSLDRPVAIKILSAALEESEMGFTERFKNEARAMAKLNHPGIVGVFDFGQTAEGLLYIVMEFVEGTDVARMLAKKGRLPVDHAMAITAHVCDALAYAHERGIIHRDIKPANIMVGYDGVVRVADFGLAKMSHDGQSGLTQSGMAMGTLHYMAPEALMLGSNVDHRADIYAVGVMLYQMLTGKLPQGMFEMPSKRVEGLDPRYDGIISKAMREDREARYQTILALRADLDHILTQPVIKVEAAAEHAPAALPTQARPQRTTPQQSQVPEPELVPPPPRSSSTTLVWAAVALLACVAGWLAVRRINKPPSTSASHVGSPSQVDQRVASLSSEKTIITPSTPLLATASKEQPFINSLGMKFVPVPGTNVLFCIHETRYSDYAAYVAENPSVDGSWKNQTHSGYVITERGEDHPATSITWNEAKAFCAWLSKKEGITYRLPQDREWSTAVGIGHLERWDAATTPANVSKDKKIFLWGNDLYPPPPGSGNFSDESRMTKAPGEGDKTGYIVGYDDGFPTTAPVMSFTPNPHGLYDLGGNVVEWCEDWLNDERKFRVQRGLSSSVWWNGHIPELFLASTRTWFPGGSRRSSFGFRCVIELSKSSQTTVAEQKPSPSPSLPAASPTNQPTVPSSPQTAPAQPPELLALEQQYRAALEKQVTPAVTEYAKTILASYRNALDRAARTPGVSSTDAAALRAETQRLTTDPTVPDTDPPGTPQSLATLRHTYRQAVAAFRSEKEAPLKTIYDKQVRELKIAGLAGATKDKPFTNSLGMKFVRLPGTNTLMCIHETRRRDYARFAAETPRLDKSWEKPHAYNGVSLPVDDDTHPASAISHDDAVAFCLWLSKHENRSYRLPTDREWSIAVGIASREAEGADPIALSGKISDHYPWGDYWPPRAGDGNYADLTFFTKFPKLPTLGEMAAFEDGYVTSAPVMSFKPNDLGIYDLGGNAEEYCDDKLTGNRSNRITRGASWFLWEQDMLSASRRFRINSNDHSAKQGFRCVLLIDDLLVEQPSGANPPTAAASTALPTTTTPPAPPPATPVPAPPAADADTLHRWTNQSGRVIRGAFIGLDNAGVKLRVDGNMVSVPLADLSNESQQQAQRLAAPASTPTGSANAPAPSSPTALPETVPATGWQPVIEDVAAAIEKSQGIYRQAPWFTMVENAAYMRPGTPNLALRITIEKRKRDQPKLKLRWAGDARAERSGVEFYWLETSSKTSLFLSTHLKSSAMHDISPPLQEGKSYELALLAVGARVAAFFEGRKVMELPLPTNPVPGTNLGVLSGFSGGIKIKNFEWVPLDDKGAVLPPQTNTAQPPNASTTPTQSASPASQPGLDHFNAGFASLMKRTTFNSNAVSELHTLYEEAVRLELEACQKAPARQIDLAAFQGEITRIRASQFPSTTATVATSTPLRQLQDAYWKAVQQVDEKLDAKAR